MDQFDFGIIFGLFCFLNWLLAAKFSNCSNSLNLKAKINCNTIKTIVPKWRKTCRGLKFDWLHFYGPQSHILLLNHFEGPCTKTFVGSSSNCVQFLVAPEFWTDLEYLEANWPFPCHRTPQRMAEVASTLQLQPNGDFKKTTKDFDQRLGMARPAKTLVPISSFLLTHRVRIFWFNQQLELQTKVIRRLPKIS